MTRLLRAAAGYACDDPARLRHAARECEQAAAAGADEGARQWLRALAHHTRRHARVVEHLVAPGRLSPRLKRDHQRLRALVDDADAMLAAGDVVGCCRAARAIARLTERHEAAERALLDLARGFQPSRRG